MAARRDLSIRVDGLKELQKALKRAEGSLGREMKGALDDIATACQRRAKAGAPKRTGQLAGSIKKSVTQRRASVFSNLVYAPVVEYGRIGHAPFTGRQFMADAVRDAQPATELALEHMLDDLTNDFERS